MTKKKAIEIALDAMQEKRRREWAFDHNLFIKGLITIRTENAHNKYKTISEAMQIIEDNYNKSLLVCKEAINIGKEMKEFSRIDPAFRLHYIGKWSNRLQDLENKE